MVSPLPSPGNYSTYQRCPERTIVKQGFAVLTILMQVFTCVGAISVFARLNSKIWKWKNKYSLKIKEND
jgi:hypothetical protein